MKRVCIGIIGFVVMVVMVAFVGIGVGFAGSGFAGGDSGRSVQRGSSYDAPSSSEPETTHVPYTPPEKPPPPEMHPMSDKIPEQRDGEDHSPEDDLTHRSIGEGQDRETPEVP
jgi:hypothetical protein